MIGKRIGNYEILAMKRRTPTMRANAAALICAIAWLVAAIRPAGADGDGFTWATVKFAIRTAYPGVKTMTTADLDARLRADSTAAVLLLDTRAEEEYAVSHLRGATLAPTVEVALDIAGAGLKDRLIVAYCSVGYRSGAVAKGLTDAGYTNVYNLEGSIFLWANQDRPVYRGDERVEQVHPFDKKWGVLLDRRFWPESFQ